MTSPPNIYLNKFQIDVLKKCANFHNKKATIQLQSQPCYLNESKREIIYLIGRTL